MPRTIHIVEPHPFTRRMLAQNLLHKTIPGGTVADTWLAMHDWGYGPDLVVLRAAMHDIWPVVLKVRALTRLRCRSVVLLEPCAAVAAEDRLRALGAQVVRTDAALAQIVQFARQSAHTEEAPHDSHMAPDLTDRQVQTTALFSATYGYTTRHIAAALNISPETVRSHVLTARRILTDHGHQVSSRSQLRQALIDTGYVVGNLSWTP